MSEYVVRKLIAEILVDARSTSDLSNILRRRMQKSKQEIMLDSDTLDYPAYYRALKRIMGLLYGDAVADDIEDCINKGYHDDTSAPAADLLDRIKHIRKTFAPFTQSDWQAFALNTFATMAFLKSKNHSIMAYIGASVRQATGEFCAKLSCGKDEAFEIVRDIFVEELGRQVNEP